MPTHEAKMKLLGFLGLCRKAGRLICGTPQVTEALGGKRPPCFVLAAQDASPATQKKLKSQTEFYRVPLYTVNIGVEELAHAVGKTGALAAVAITDEGMATALLSRIEAMEQSDAECPISTGKEPSREEGKDA